MLKNDQDKKNIDDSSYKFNLPTNLLKYLLLISIAVAVGSVVSDILQFNMLNNMYSDLDAEENDNRQSLVIAIYFVVFLRRIRLLGGRIDYI